MERIETRRRIGKSRKNSLSKINDSEDTIRRLVAHTRCVCDMAKYSDQLRQFAKQGDFLLFKKMSNIYKALGDERRQNIIYLLLEKEMCVCEILTALECNQSTVSHHLRILENAGVVTSRREGKWVFYRVIEEERVKQLNQIVSSLVKA